MIGAAEASHIHRGREPVPNSLKFIPQKEQAKDRGMKMVAISVSLCTLTAVFAERLDSSNTELLASVAMP